MLPRTAPAAIATITTSTYGSATLVLSCNITTNVITSNNIGVTEAALSLVANDNNYTTIPWTTESWLWKLIRYERIATASPRIGMGLIGTGLIQHLVNLIPTLHSAADFLYVHDDYGRAAGVRPKMATWPLSKKEVLSHREWAT